MMPGLFLCWMPYRLNFHLLHRSSCLTRCALRLRVLTVGLLESAGPKTSTPRSAPSSPAGTTAVPPSSGQRKDSRTSPAAAGGWLGVRGRAARSRSSLSACMSQRLRRSRTSGLDGGATRPDGRQPTSPPRSTRATLPLAVPPRWADPNGPISHNAANSITCAHWPRSSRTRCPLPRPSSPFRRAGSAAPSWVRCGRQSPGRPGGCPQTAGRPR